MVASFDSAAAFKEAILDEVASFGEASVNTNIGLPYFGPSLIALSIPAKANSGQSPPPLARNRSMSDTKFARLSSLRYVTGPVPESKSRYVR